MLRYEKGFIRVFPNKWVRETEIKTMTAEKVPGESEDCHIIVELKDGTKIRAFEKYKSREEAIKGLSDFFLGKKDTEVVVIELQHPADLEDAINKAIREQAHYKASLVDMKVASADEDFVKVILTFQ